MSKIIIEVEGGLVSAVYTQNEEDQIIIIDHDIVRNGESPVSPIKSPDGTFLDGEAYQQFVMNDIGEEVIREHLKRIKF